MTDCLETTKYKLKRKEKKEQPGSQEYVKSMYDIWANTVLS